MAERVIVVELNIKTGDSGKELESTKQALEYIEDEIRNIDKAVAKESAKSAFEALNKVVDENVLSIQELGTAADNYKNIALAAGLSSPIGQEAIAKAAQLENEMDRLNQTVAQVAEGGARLNTAMQLGTGVIAGYSAFQGVTALLGKDNEALQETFVKLQAAQAALMGVKELSIALDKEGLLMTQKDILAKNLLSAATVAYNTVVGTSTGVLKAFRLALASTGIGLIIVGIGLLVANWEEFVKWIESSSEALVDFANKFLPIRSLIEWWTGATYEQIKAEDKAAEQRKKNHAEWSKQLNEKLKGLKDERKAQQDAHNERQELFDLEIERLEALGKSSNDLKLQKLQDLQDEFRAQLQFIIDSGKAWEAYYEQRRLESGQSREDFIADQKAKGIDLQKGLDNQAALMESLENKIFSSESKIIAFQRSVREKNKSEIKDSNNEIIDDTGKHNAEMLKLAEDDLKAREKQADELFTDRKKITERIEKWERGQMFDKFQIEMDDLKSQFDEEMELFVENEEIRAQLTKEFEDNLLEIKKEAQKADEALDKEEMDRKLAKISESIELAETALGALNEINDVMNEFGERRIEKIQEERDKNLANLEADTAKQLANEKLSAEQKAKIEQQSAMAEYKIRKQAAEAEDKIAEKQFKREKALKLAEIAINTASAIVKGIAQFGPPPSPLGIAAIATAGAIGISQAALVASQKFKGTAGSITPPSFTAPSFDDSTTSNNSNNNNSQNDTTTETDALLNPPIIISQVEINKVQKDLARIEDVSIL